MTLDNQVSLDLLGKNIHDVPSAYTSLPDAPSHEDFYTLDKPGKFLGKEYLSIFLSVNEDRIIELIIISLDGFIIDKSFYDALVEKYGEPNGMYKRGEVISQEPEKVYDDGFIIGPVTRSTIEECTFEESPLIIAWNKEDYDIEVWSRNRIFFGKGPYTNTKK